MGNKEISEIKNIFLTRLDVLGHILSIGENSFSDTSVILNERLAPDMLPFGTQVVFACNQPRGFSQWCAGLPVENLNPDVDSWGMARSHISQTRELVSGISADDSKLDEIKRIGLGPGKYCELPARQYINDFLMPNLYFHITIAYAILRKMGAPVGKADFMDYLKPYVREEAVAE